MDTAYSTIINSVPGDITNAANLATDAVPLMATHYDGRLDNLLVFNHALSAEEVTAHYNGGAGIEI